MRSNSLRLVIPVLAALAAAGCKKEGVEGPLAACRPVSYACAGNGDCCSFGCISGVCQANPLEGGVCSNTDDCLYPRVCADQRCTSSIACRPSGTCTYANQCCSGVCTLGQCAGDQPPVAVIRFKGAAATTLNPQPFHIPMALDSVGSTDPNTGTVGLTYHWTVFQAPAGSLAQPETPMSATTIFTPDVASIATQYVLQLTVTAGGLSGSTTISFYAINTAPEITMPADILGTPFPSCVHQPRNVPLHTVATVSDADGGPVTCSWTKKSPTGTPVQISPPTSCAGASGTAATGTSTPPDLSEDESGTWELTLTATDGVNTVSKTRFVYVDNDPPVANAGPKRWGNFNLGPIPLHGTATDVNGDVVNGNQGDATFTWLWTVKIPSPGSKMTVGTAIDTPTPDVSFTPDAEGPYTLTLTVDDHHGGCAGGSDTSDVVVQVEPYILPLGEVVDAEYVEGSSPERLVIAQVDAGNAYKLTIVNPTDLLGTVIDVPLATRPTALALNFTPPAQSEAIVAETGGIFQHVTGIQTATPAVAHTVPALSALPADLMDVVHAGTYAYGLTASGTVYLLDPVGTSGTWWTPVSCPTCGTTPVGTRAVGGMTGAGTTPTIWLMQGGSPSELARYDVHTNGNLLNQVRNTAGTFAGAMGVWLSADGADVYTTRASVFDALSATLAQRVTTDLPAVPDHLDTAVSSTLVGAIAQYSTASLMPFSRASVGGAFTSGMAKAYPILGVNGDPVTNYGRFAFVKSGGGGYYAIVRANVGTVAAPVYRWGAVNLGP